MSRRKSIMLAAGLVLGLSVYVLCVERGAEADRTRPDVDVVGASPGEAPQIGERNPQPTTGRSEMDTERQSLSESKTPSLVNGKKDPEYSDLIAVWNDRYAQLIKARGLASVLDGPLGSSVVLRGLDAKPSAEIIAKIQADVAKDIERVAQLEKSAEAQMDAVCERRIAAGNYERVVPGEDGSVTTTARAGETVMRVLRGTETFAVRIIAGEEPSVEAARGEAQMAMWYLLSDVRQRIRAQQ